MLFFFFNDTATTEIYTLSLHDALPILDRIARDADERLAWGSVERIGGEAILTFGAGAAGPRRPTAPVRGTRAAGGEIFRWGAGGGSGGEGVGGGGDVHAGGHRVGDGGGGFTDRK